MTSSLLKSIISIPSPSREEKAVADFLQHWLEEHGLAPHRCGDNLWCSKGSGPVLLLDAHIDTVKPAHGWETDPFTPVCDGNRITGLGANDDGGSVVAMIKAFMEATPKSHTLVLSLSAQEEVSGSGGLESVLPVIEKACGSIEAGIIGEPTSLKMATSENGLRVLDCEAHGRAGHAARGDGSNAIANALPDIQWFLDNGSSLQGTASWLPGRQGIPAFAPLRQRHQSCYLSHCHPYQKRGRLSDSGQMKPHSWF